MSRLSHRIVHRRGWEDGGAYATERFSVDFLVDGVSLCSTLSKALGSKPDFMGALVVGDDAWNVSVQQQLQLDNERSPDFKSETNRFMLYICAECGDIGCGAFTLSIEHTCDAFTWHSFAYETDLDPPIELSQVGPYVFEVGAYRNAIAAASGAAGNSPPEN